MEEYIGLINGKPSRNRAVVLRQNRIKTRHYAIDKNGQQLFSSAEMASKAIQNALHQSEVLLSDITYLATSSTLGDMLVPGLASHVHAEMKFPPLEIANFQSVCSSSLMAIKSAYLQIKAHEHRCAVVSGSDFASRYFRPGFYQGTSRIDNSGELSLEADFLRFTLSDGAGAMVLEDKPNTRNISLEIKWIDIKSYADRFQTCMMAGATVKDSVSKFWTEYESPAEAMQDGAIMLVQDFTLLKRMIPVWIKHYIDLIEQGKIKIEDIDFLCSHYSSHSLREEAIIHLKKAGVLIDEEKWVSNLPSKGNTGTASIFILLEELFNSGKLKKGHKILCHVPESGRALNGLMLCEVV
jgi:3-oxoacyl-[acyl-carrier-protein] synthase-3